MIDKMKITCKADEIQEGGLKSIITRHGRILIIRKENSFFAMEDKCTHDDFPLHDGKLSDYTIECCRHGAQFDIRDGACLRMPATEPLETYPVTVTKNSDGEALLEIILS